MYLQCVANKTAVARFHFAFSVAIFGTNVTFVTLRFVHLATLPQGVLQVMVCIVDVPLSSPPLFHASLFPSRATPHSSALTSSWMGLRSLRAVARLTMSVLFAAQFMLNIGLYFHILSARLCERVVCALASTNLLV